MNPFILLLLASITFSMTGIMIGVYVSQPRKNRIIKLSPETGRGIEYQVEKEDAVNLICKAVGDTPPLKFRKTTAAWNIIRKGVLNKLQHYALWLGQEGTAYTFPLNAPDIKITLRQTVENVFGLELYKQLSADIKNRIESASVGVTVEFPQQPLTPMGKDGKSLPSVSEYDIQRDDDAKILHALATGIAKAKQGFSWNMLFAIGTGVAIGIIIGIIIAIIFKLGGTTTVVQQPTPIK